MVMQAREDPELDMQSGQSGAREDRYEAEYDYPLSQTYDPVTEIEHFPEVSDFMSGALSAESNEPNVHYNDKLDCIKDIYAQFDHMPWRILTARSLAEISGLFHDPATCFEILGDRFLTTNAGLRRAVEECQHTELREYDRDTLLLGALAKRGGRVSINTTGREVVYPEDMMPIIDKDSRLYDEVYWEQLYAQGEVWNEMTIQVASGM